MRHVPTYCLLPIAFSLLPFPYCLLPKKLYLCRLILEIKSIIMNRNLLLKLSVAMALCCSVLMANAQWSVGIKGGWLKMFMITLIQAIDLFL